MSLAEKLYLEYVNDFITVARFAEHHEISEGLANAIIEEGREINHSNELHVDSDGCLVHNEGDAEVN
jgi:hypothetical protein